MVWCGTYGAVWCSVVMWRGVVKWSGAMQSGVKWCGVVLCGEALCGVVCSGVKETEVYTNQRYVSFLQFDAPLRYAQAVNP